MTMSVERSASLVIEPFIAPLAEWSFKGKGMSAHVSGQPGTWCKREDFMPRPWLALFCCPNCRTIQILNKGVHTLDGLGKVSPDYKCMRCTFHRSMYLDRWNVKPLYACAIIEDNKPRFVYTHATNQQEARIQLGNGNYRIVAIGRAVGAFVESESGDGIFRV